MAPYIFYFYALILINWFYAGSVFKEHSVHPCLSVEGWGGGVGGLNLQLNFQKGEGRGGRAWQDPNF